MKPAVVDHVAPSTLEETARLLGAAPDDSKVLAGGQSLVPMLNMRLSRPEMLVDISRVRSLDYIDATADRLDVGAIVTQAALARRPDVRDRWPVLSEAIRHIGHAQIRNRGTVVGSLAHHDPAAELPALALALDARLTLYSTRGPRVVDAADFFVGTFQTALVDDEVLAQVSFAAPPPGAGWAFREVSRKHGDFATVGAVALLGRSSGVIDWARIVLFGVGGTPFRAVTAEDLLLGNAINVDTVRAAAAAAELAINPAGDVHATAEYRRELAGTLVRSTIEAAWERSA